VAIPGRADLSTAEVADGLARLQSAAPRPSPLDDHPALQTFVECWLETFLVKGKVDPRLREQAILRVMWRCDRVYEWTNHYRLARRVGVTDDEVLSLRCADPRASLSGPAAVVACAADEIVDLGVVTPETMVEVRALFTDPGVLQEFLMAVAGYRMFATVSASVRRDPATASWPPDGVGPS
jgi:Carboxymuconolactone decarboxylase family